MKFLVYLAGAITGCSFDGATDWRVWAKEMLQPDILGLSPMRAKEYLRRYGEITAQPYNEHVLSTAQGISNRDRNDVMRCDLVLMNLLGTRRVSIGTMIEIGWADAFRKPIVLVMEAGNIHEHAMVQHLCAFRVETLPEGVAVCKAVLLPDGR